MTETEMVAEPTVPLPAVAYLPPPVPELPASLVHGAMVLPSRNAIVEMRPKNAVILEVGVALGLFSLYTLQVAEPKQFIAVDNFKLHDLAEFGDVSRTNILESSLTATGIAPNSHII